MKKVKINVEVEITLRTKNPKYCSLMCQFRKGRCALFFKTLLCEDTSTPGDTYCNWKEMRCKQCLEATG